MTEQARARGPCGPSAAGDRRRAVLPTCQAPLWAVRRCPRPTGSTEPPRPPTSSALSQQREWLVTGQCMHRRQATGAAVHTARAPTGEEHGAKRATASRGHLKRSCVFTFCSLEANCRCAPCPTSALTHDNSNQPTPLCKSLQVPWRHEESSTSNHRRYSPNEGLRV